MSDSVKTVRFLGKDVARTSVETALFTATAFLVVFNLVSIPFALPKLRSFVGAPFVPSSRQAFQAVLDNVPELRRADLKMVDIGSGDGRLVMEASRRGINAVGIELNPWLVFISKMRLRSQGFKSPILCMNAWRSISFLESFKPDLLTFYGRPGQEVLARFGALAEDVSDRTGKELIIASNKFPIPGWNIRLIAHINGFFIYRLHSDRI
jgi:hypothetical protein